MTTITSICSGLAQLTVLYWWHCLVERSRTRCAGIEMTGSGSSEAVDVAAWEMLSRGLQGKKNKNFSEEIGKL